MASETLTIARNHDVPRRIQPAIWGALLLWWALVALMVAVPDKPQGFAAPRFVNETHELFAAIALLLSALAIASGVFPRLTLLAPAQSTTARCA